MARKASWWGRITGEISKLRTAVTGWSIRAGRLGGGYKLDSSRVDYALARQLYDNTHDNYKLGGAFAKPVVNTTVAFMGVPRFRSEDEEAQAVLDDFFGDNVSRMQQVHTGALREGDAYVMLTREEDEDAELYPETNGARLVFNILPPEQVAAVNRDPITGSAREYVLRSEHTWTDESDNRRRCTVTQRIRRDTRKVEVEGDTPPDVQTGEQPNQWGFIPIVHFRNEASATAAFGKSDLEPVEPFLRAYHDVMLHAINGSKMHSTPRLKLRLKDVSGFLLHNFGISDVAKFAAEGKTINLDGRELLILTDGEDAEFIEVRSAIGDAASLLKLLFYCLVDVSETPEFAFGVHTPSSLSSVKEQMPILIRRVARKREHFTEQWQMAARMALAMTAAGENKAFSTYATTVLWDEIDPRDDGEVADALWKTTQALNTAVLGGFLSREAAAMFLAQYIDTMAEWISDDPELPGERERIIKDRILMARLDGAEEEELEMIEKALELASAARAGGAGD
jgi:hypothetical protein